MNRGVVAHACAAIVLSAAACGVPEGRHRASLRDLERAKANVAAQARRYDQADALARKHLATCDEARVSADARVRVLEQQLLLSKEARGELVGDLNALEARELKLRREQARAGAQRGALRMLIERFGPVGESGLATVEVRGGRLTITLQADELFEGSTPTLRDEASVVLDRLAEVLRSLPSEEFRVEGHTDPGVEPASDWELSIAWSMATVAELLRRDVAAERLSAAAFGASRPEVSNETDGHRALNRRVQLVHVPVLDNIPGFDVVTPDRPARGPSAE